MFLYVRAQCILAKSGRRTSNCRFGGTVAAAMFNLPLWGMQTFQRKYTALMLGHLQNKKTLGKLTVRFKHMSEEDASTNPRRITVESKAVKKLCQ